MTGIEAVSNAVPAFRPVEWRNARTTLTAMISPSRIRAGVRVHPGGHCGGPAAGREHLLQRLPAGAVPDGQGLIGARSFLRIGNRLTFRNGIIALSLIAAVGIYAVSRGNTESLIPLYAVGVFLAFTMSQAGW